MLLFSPGPATDVGVKFGETIGGVITVVSVLLLTAIILIAIVSTLLVKRRNTNSRLPVNLYWSLHVVTLKTFVHLCMYVKFVEEMTGIITTCYN